MSHLYTQLSHHKATQNESEPALFHFRAQNPCQDDTFTSYNCEFPKRTLSRNKALAFTYWGNKFKQQLQDPRNPLSRASQILYWNINFTPRATIWCNKKKILPFLNLQKP